MSDRTEAFQIDSLNVYNGGVIGLAYCPGRCGLDAQGPLWRRSMDKDVATIHNWGAAAVVSLVTLSELKNLAAGSLSSALSARNIIWHHCPINDRQAPDFRFEAMWSKIETKLLRLLCEQRRVLLHCAAGLGRTGTVAARLLIASGVPAPQALARVRAVRPGTVETAVQERYLLALCDA